MKAADKYNVNLLGADEQALRLDRVYGQMKAAGIDFGVVSSNVSLYYLTGRVFRGYMLIGPSLAAPRYFVRRPNHLTGADVTFIRKPEEMASALPGVPALELGSMSYDEAIRLAAVFGGTPAADLSAPLRRARAVKTEREQAAIRMSGEKHTLVYERIPHLFREGMTDVEFQIEIERALRLEGNLGIFRVAGNDMELFMGNVLTGENADTPSPYDFAMGGAGIDPSLPVGADGTVIKPGAPVMVDVNGDFTGYMTDMTRMYVSGEPSAEAERACRLSADICRAVRDAMRPGAKASDLYALALRMATHAGMEHYFMGHRYHAGFVGHGIGIEVNELPVLAPRSRDVLEAGNVIAVEPKFVLPGIGAVGIENTYIVKSEGPAEQVTNAPENFIQLD